MYNVHTLLYVENHRFFRRVFVTQGGGMFDLYICTYIHTEVGASLCQIALLLFAFEQTSISRARSDMRKRSKSGDQTYKIHIKSGSLFSHIMKKEQINLKSNLTD